MFDERKKVNCLSRSGVNTPVLSCILEKTERDRRAGVRRNCRKRDFPTLSRVVFAVVLWRIKSGRRAEGALRARFPGKIGGQPDGVGGRKYCLYGRGALYLAVMPRRVRADLLIPDSRLFEA